MEVTRDLWHAVLFYNAGEITRRALSAAGAAIIRCIWMHRRYSPTFGPRSPLTGRRFSMGRSLARKRCFASCAIRLVRKCCADA